jgi:hypothetical protein
MKTQIALSIPSSQIVARKPAAATDSYLRLPIARFTDLEFDHLFSECDPLLLDELRLQGMSVFAAGISEWKSMGKPEISLGWSWYVESGGRLMLAPEPVRTNLMLSDSHGYDMGQSITSDFLRTWLLTFPWQSAVVASVNLRFPTC